MPKTKDHIPPSHPGTDLLELIEDHGLTQYRLAKELGVPQTRIMQIIRGQRSITADTALRLSRFFGMSGQFWMNRQMNYDLEMAYLDKGREIEAQITPLRDQAA